MNTAPETIWLQRPCRDMMSEWDGEITWCEDKQNDDDTEYVRADLLTAENERITVLEVEAASCGLLLLRAEGQLTAEREVSSKLATLLTDALDSFASNLEGGEADEWVVLSRTALTAVAAIRATHTSAEQA